MNYWLISRLQSTLGAARRSPAAYSPRYSSPHLTSLRQHSLAALALGIAAAGVQAQTAPTLPGANTGTAASGATTQVLLNEELEANTQGIEASPPTATFSIVGDKEAREGLGALRWNYVLEDDNKPQIGLEGGTGLDAAGSVRFWLKTSQPSAIAVWFETAREAGVETPPQRLVAHVWSRGGDWQAIEIARERFVLENPAATDAKATPAQNAAGQGAAGQGAAAEVSSDTERAWSRITRYGVMDVTNVWLQRAGQSRLKATRSLWLDSILVSTTLAANAPVAPPVPVATAPQAAPEEDEEPVRPVAPPRVPQNRPPYAGSSSSSSSSSSSGYGDQFPGAQGTFDGPQEGFLEGEEEFGEEEENEQAPAAPVDPPVVIVQDGFGDGRLWIPINSQTTDSEKGLEWNLVRLANRNLSLMMPVASQLFTRYPVLSIQPEAKGKGVNLGKLGKADRWVRLVLELSTQKATRLNVSVTERGGATYSMAVPLDQRRKRHRQILPLPRFQLERTSRDTNNQIDLDQIEYLTITDVGAQTGTAGPNLIRINGLAWMY
ncbi:MAG: hypothetical protein JWN98_1072 [Abditibacteriota bacterium]|nr:hypothetical protein [Abditibacteriota bacterium]